MVRIAMMANNNKTDNKNKTEDLSPTADEIINELLLLNSRLMMENIALKISFNKLRDFVQYSKESSIDTLEE